MRDTDHPLTRGLGTSFEVEDEPYFIELQDPGSTRILLTADYGPSGVSPTSAPLYGSDTSLQPDGKTRVIGYTREIGNGGVASSLSAIATIRRSAPAGRRPGGHDAADLSRLVGIDAFITLLRNTIAWGVGA